MRLDDAAAKACAKRLVSNRSLVTLWSHFSDELREMIVDAAVMDAVRLADDETPVETGRLIAFRGRVVSALAEGVFVGKTKHGLTFERDREYRYLRGVRSTTIGGAS